MSATALTTLDDDRGRKLHTYARASIPEVWILDLNRSTLEVCRHPAGRDYPDRVVLTAEASVSPLARPDASIRVADLLP